jgi:cytochrome d ubiquinol oxidase subunit II
MHGAIYLAPKVEGDLRARCEKWATNLWVVFVIFYVVMTLWSWLTSPFLFEYAFRSVLFFVLFILLIAAMILLPVLIRAGKFGRAFLASSMIIVAMIGQVALSLYPRFVPSSINLDYSLTIYNSSSSPTTLQTMLVIALIGMPCVIAYSIFIHRVFRGKVEITEDSY